MRNVLKKYENIALSNKDILKLVKGKANIVLYHDLHKYKSIDKVLGKYGACFLLFESKKNYGHWCLLFKLDDTNLEFFNPYNGYPDDSLDYVPNDFKKISNQDQPYLSTLLYQSPYQLSFNEFGFQAHNKNIKTCGRWCCLRLICRHMSLYDFNNLIKSLCNELNLNPDQLVTLLTMYINE